jgi:hypothetical protein
VLSGSKFIGTQEVTIRLNPIVTFIFATVTTLLKGNYGT